MALTIDEIKYRLRTSVVLQLVAVNVAVFLLLRVVAIVLFLGAVPNAGFAACRWIELPSSLPELALKPWTVATYMFAQYDFLHILFNMLWLWWFGQLYINISTPRRLVTLYFIGGLEGALLYLLAYNLLPVFAGTESMLIGSSAAVLAIVTATALLMPDYRIGLFLIGFVKLKWIAIGVIVIVLMSVSGANAGGEIAHIGGIISGALYAIAQKRGVHIRNPFAGMLKRRTKKSKKSKVPKAEPSAAADTTDLDIILDKIKKSGYGGLTADEKKRLFEISSRIKDK